MGVTIAAREETTDRDLVLSARKERSGGEPFRVLYERHGPEVLAFLVRLLRDEPLAEDVLQETFLRAHGALDRYDEERSLRAWLLGIARNAALDALRIRAKAEHHEAERARGAGPGPRDLVAQVATLEEGEQARAALDALPADKRAILIQRHGLDMKIVELAESLAVTEKTAASRLRAALVELTEALLSVRGRS